MNNGIFFDIMNVYKEDAIMHNCGYCQGGELLAAFGIKICDLKVSQLILFNIIKREFSHPI